MVDMIPLETHRTGTDRKCMILLQGMALL